VQTSYPLRSAPGSFTLAAAAICAWCFLVQSASAQLTGAGQTGLNAVMLKLLEEFPFFSSRTEMTMQEKGSSDVMTMAVDMAKLNPKVRVDLDMDTLKSKQVPPQTIAGFKAAGMGRVITVIRPDQKSALLIYPMVRSYVDLPMAKEEVEDLARMYKLQKTKLGSETIDGQSCDKMKVVITADNGAKHEAVVWYAPALRNFPVKVQMDQPQSTVVMLFRSIKVERPDSKQFEAPDGYNKHASVEALLQTSMKKMLGDTKKP
jgi:hypothetical protein